MRPRDAAAPADLDYQPSMCPYCGVGCGLLVQVRDGRVTKVKGDLYEIEGGGGSPGR